MRCGKSSKYNFAFCAAAGGAEERGTFESVLNLKYFIQDSEVSVAHSKLTVAP